MLTLKLTQTATLVKSNSATRILAAMEARAATMAMAAQQLLALLV